MYKRRGQFLISSKCANRRRERKWKLLQARRFAKKAETSEKNIFLRAAAREKEEQLRVRRRAAWIAKEVRSLSAVHCGYFEGGLSALPE